MAKCGCLQGSLEASHLLYKPWGGSFEASCDTMLPTIQNMFSEQDNAIGTHKITNENSPYSNTSNPGWKNHSIMSWGANNNDPF